MAKVEAGMGAMFGETPLAAAGAAMVKRGGPIRKTVDYGSPLVRLLEVRPLLC